MTKELSTVNVFCGVAYTSEQVSQPFGCLPQTQGQALKLAEFYSQSGTVPKDYIGYPGNILVAMEFGAEIGLKPLASLQNIAVINGRPSLWGDALLGLVLAHKDNQGVDESFDIKTQTATCLVKRKGRKEITWTFSFADAVAAGIRNNPVWKTYPRRMAQMRARGFAIRDMWADVLKGLGSAEEQRDIANAKDITPDVELSREQPAGQSSSDSLAAELDLANKKAEVERVIDAFVAETEQKPAQTEAPDDLEPLLIAISDCAKLSDLTDLVDRCAALPEHLKPAAKQQYAAKQKELKGSAKATKKDPDTCFKCTNKDNLSTCGQCGHDYCLTHWPSGLVSCKTCVDLDGLITEDDFDD